MPKTNLTDELYNYVLKFGVKEHPVLSQIQEYNQTLPNGRMQIAPEQGQFMALLAKITKAQKYLEVGVFTGYSSLTMALGMGEAGKLYVIDNNQDNLDIAHKFWQLAGVKQQIKAILGDATVILETLSTPEHLATFDIAFIDANKSSYIEHYEYCYKLVRPGGIILIDNTLMNGKVLDASTQTHVKAVNHFNTFIYNDNRVDIVMLPIADGLTIAYKKEI